MRTLLRRLLWLVAMLLGITFATFAVIDLAPVDRAELAVARAAGDRAFADLDDRQRAIVQLRIQHGMIDPATLEPTPLWRRYALWLGNAAQLRFAGPGGDHAALWARLAQAWPPTALLGGLALLLAFGVGVPLGVRLGGRAGTRGEGLASAALLATYAAAVGINLARGRRSIDCGCGGTPRPIQPWLVGRNLVLAAASLALLAPVGARALGGLDALNAAMALAVAIGLYATLEQWLHNRQAMREAARQRAEAAAGTGFGEG